MFEELKRRRFLFEELVKRDFKKKYPDKTLELHLDYYGRVPRREIELYTADDVVVCDFIKAEIKFLKSGERIDLAEERNEYCLREIAYFFDFALDGAANINSIPYANSVIGFVQGGVVGCRVSYGTRRCQSS